MCRTMRLAGNSSLFIGIITFVWYSFPSVRCASCARPSLTSFFLYCCCLSSWFRLCGLLVHSAVCDLLLCMSWWRSTCLTRCYINVSLNSCWSEIVQSHVQGSLSDDIFMLVRLHVKTFIRLVVRVVPTGQPPVEHCDMHLCSVSSLVMCSGGKVGLDNHASCQPACFGGRV